MLFLKSFIDFITTPSHFLFMLATLALIMLLLRWRRTAITCLTLSLAGFVAFGFTSLSEVMIAPLVSRFPPVDHTVAAPPFGLIVLGGGMNETTAQHNRALMEFIDGGEAIPTTVLLAQRYPNAKIILSDGNGADGWPPAPLRATDAMNRVLKEFGIASDRIRADTQSTTTAERVSNTLRLIGDDRDQTWWVITPAHRMPRVIGTFRKDNFNPIPYPIDFKWVPPFDPSYTYALLDGLRLTDEGAHEWRGLVFYYLGGRIDDLFPGPQTRPAEG
ncbi:MAG: uncharacterized SAM-binding protein YcdF (DUF218 family) [Glaciecola sp.]|jgi:uncharacterized SAM-binding protein YcdF (DUF218 family)